MNRFDRIAMKVAFLCNKSFKREMLTKWGIRELHKGRPLLEVQADISKWMKKTVGEVKEMVSGGK